MTTEIVLGILTGHGPRTTAPFLDRIVTFCQNLYGAKLDSDLPHMLIYSLPVPFFPNKAGGNEIIKEHLFRGIDRLKNAQIHILAVPSNYIHHYYDYIKEIINIPILNIVNVTVESLPKNNPKLALLAANSTIDNGSYQKELENNNIHFFHNDELQDNVSQLIISLKQTGLSSHSLKLWKKICNYCLDNNCDSIINTNSEISHCLKYEGSEYFTHITDSYDALASACVKKYLLLSQQNNLKFG
ncbi:aspartate/glutamate racemase family protein [Fluviispira sanaruensis]|uniref:Uncharacterized protein n=1 Tax=Fluviispira sanaruensis TaxID=2493639 RepID=A0A4P2VV02_FLUSA|nr:aspartate/glutamate racemase family protein [Fluviispira sanaruensis]BBH53345.1 hypothetical protein JCM31447_17880 [Fluviispira sanaruensis]